MTLTTGTAGPLLTPEQVESLLIKPVLAAGAGTSTRCSRHRSWAAPLGPAGVPAGWSSGPRWPMCWFTAASSPPATWARA